MISKMQAVRPTPFNQSFLFSFRLSTPHLPSFHVMVTVVSLHPAKRPLANELCSTTFSLSGTCLLCVSQSGLQPSIAALGLPS
jgi:hypothetical protein